MDGMNGFLLLPPFLLIRFGLLSYLNKDAVKRAAYFAPISGNEAVAYWIYQISNSAIFIYLLFLRVKTDFTWLFFIGIVCYILGLILCAFSVKGFSYAVTYSGCDCFNISDIRPLDYSFGGKMVYGKFWGILQGVHEKSKKVYLNI